VGIGVALDDGRAWYIPVGHRERHEYYEQVPTTYRGKTHKDDGTPYTRKKKLIAPWQDSPLLADQLALEDALEFIRFVYMRCERVVAHNAKYEMLCSLAWVEGLADGLLSGHLLAKRECSLICDWLVRSSADITISHGLKSAVQREFVHDMITYDDVTKGSGDKQIAFADIEETALYCGDDARQCLRLWREHQPALDEMGLRKAYEEVQLPILDLLVRMERTGVFVDPDPLRDLHRYVMEEIGKTEAAIEELLGRTVNLASPKELAHQLYEEIGFQHPQVKKGKSGGIPVNKFAMAWFQENGTEQEQKFADLKLRWSELETLRARFTSTIEAFVDEDGRIRANNRQCGTETGRLSQSDPNLMNIPSRTELGKKVRDAFVAPKGRKLVVADYSQLEPRVTAHYSQDENLIHVYEEDKDIYQHLVDDMAAKTGIVRSRHDGKILVLAMNYGMAVPTLAKTLGVEVLEAQRIYDGFQETTAGVVAWKRGVVQAARRDGYVTTLTKRRRHLPDIRLFPNCHRTPQQRCRTCFSCQIRRERAERQAVNTVIQGSAADIVLLAMRNIDRVFVEGGLDANILFQVHDEILVECDENEADEVAMIMKWEMENVVSLRVPLVTEPAIVSRWSEAK
jgi:DNA polymerase-1